MKSAKKILTLLLALLLAVSLSACGSAPQEEEAEGEDSSAADPAQTETDPPEPAEKPLAVTTVSRPNYHFDLPETLTMEEGDGDVDLMREGKVIGGIWTLEYDKAESLRDEATLDGAVPTIVELVAPDNSMFSLFEGAYGDFSISFVQEGGNTAHTFYTQEDRLFDVWVLDDGLTKEETETLFSSFALTQRVTTEVG